MTVHPHHPELDEGAVDPAQHLVTDEELQLLLAHDHDERAADRANVKKILTGAALGGVALAAIALVVAVFALIARDPSPTRTIIQSAPVIHDHEGSGRDRRRRSRPRRRWRTPRA